MFVVIKDFFIHLRMNIQVHTSKRDYLNDLNNYLLGEIQQ